VGFGRTTIRGLFKDITHHKHIRLGKKGIHEEIRKGLIRS